MNSDSSSSSSNSSQARSESPTSTAITYIPSSKQTLLTTSLISKLATSDDLRYHLTWTYGGFIEDIPIRIGHNAALDAAAAALVASHSSIVTRFPRSGSHTIEALRTYCHALWTLRHTLSSTSQCRDPSTLCAVMLLLIVQAFLGFHSCAGSAHAEGAAELLKARGRMKSTDEFETKLLMGLRAIVLFEGLVNRRIVMSERQWEELVFSEFDDSTRFGVAMKCLGRVPGFMARGRSALLPTERGEWELEILRVEMEECYVLVKEILAELKNDLEAAQAGLSPANTSVCLGLATARRSKLLWAHWQRLYGLGISIVLVFNTILQAVTLDRSPELIIDARQLSEEVLDLAEQAQVFRPLGASFVGICLATAWCACEELRPELEEVGLDYRRDFRAEEEEDLKSEMAGWSRRLRLLEP